MIIGDNPEKLKEKFQFVKFVKWCTSLDIETSLSSTAKIFNNKTKTKKLGYCNNDVDE